MTMVKRTNAGGRTKGANERSIVSTYLYMDKLNTGLGKLLIIHEGALYINAVFLPKQ